MSKFKISAPGRIVLSGEHGAIYGNRVVMASLDRRTTLKFIESIDDTNIIKIDFPDVNLLLNVPLETVEDFVSNDHYEDPISIHMQLLKFVNHFITLNNMWSTYEQRFSLQIFFFLLYSIVRYEELDLKPFYVHVSTELPIRAGLGSSSSFAVCLAACFLHWARLQIGAHYAFNEQEIIMISKYTMYCEGVIQDYVYMDDNKVCSYGKIIRYRLINPDYYHNRALNVSRMKILLIDSNIRQNRGERAKQIAELKYSHPNFDFILNSFDEISNQICTTIIAINDNHRYHNLLQLQDSYAQLQLDIQSNQDLLHNLGLSHSRFDTICSIAKDFKFGGKLTGFGGGFVYILLSPCIPEERITNLSIRLMEEGFNITITSVSCSGVTIDD